MSYKGNIRKMSTELVDSKALYHLPMGDDRVDMNALVGQKLKFEFKGQINCIHTGEQIKKSYGQGYSYKSFITLAQCDTCIVKPELCHFHKGTCREPEWGEKNCFIPHYVYLAVSSHVKVGITRHTQIPTRWIDQGASYALPILKVDDRKTSGEIEIEIAKNFSDKTNWRKMLMNEVADEDLESLREQIYDDFADIFDDFDAEDVEEDITHIEYPVLEYPTKVKSLGFDKNPIIEGTLQGIKGQYLIFDTGVVNMRKHAGYHLELTL
ncbi:DUF2797 domain-containing protein [Bacteriovorax sp. DB6_IX]|uniref:DUF2797 domain-containing protein n=1 Tax=Bacteriovorax sp. DB6_IX TaxID=1353530 RepID=UPI00038A3169|nr:DUF2797 domain-containing protein [Bacteriovorax sp. DB6_IX]EQC48734.1 PF10977 family protein [Bacteriovorax sp. DB6_IX]